MGLAGRADDKVAKYSMGVRQHLGVATCLLADPELLVLDEPMNGLDPAGMSEMRDMIPALVAEDRRAVLSSHLLDEVERTCDAVAIVDRARSSARRPLPSAPDAPWRFDITDDDVHRYLPDTLAGVGALASYARLEGGYWSATAHGILRLPARACPRAPKN